MLKPPISRMIYIPSRDNLRQRVVVAPMIKPNEDIRSITNTMPYKFTHDRAKLKNFIWFCVGDRVTIYAWFDNWCALSQLASFISNRDIYKAGLGLSAKVNEIIDSGMWSWPTDWVLKYPMLANLNVPNLSNASDGIVWRHISNGDSDFSVAKA
ncbi:hypothetical protein Tco_0722592 [Tanacetum coccineum]